MKDKRTTYDRLLARIKNQRSVAVAIVFGVVVIALASFTDSVKKLIGLAPVKSPSVHHEDISGSWATDTLTNPYDEDETYRLVFHFEVKGDAIVGTVTEESPDEEGDPVTIVDGKINANAISFYTIGEVSGYGPEPKPYREHYYGTISKTEINFTRQADLPASVLERFTARRE